jgi:hypothetical protein
MRRTLTRTILAGCALLLAHPAVAAMPPVRVIESRDFPRVAAAAALGSGLRVENVQVPETGEAAAFALERFEVFADDATVTIHGKDGAAKTVPAPANAYFRGTVVGEPGSRVFLAAFPDGRTEGIVNRAGETYLIGGDETPTKALDAPLEMRRVEPVLMKAARGEGFACANAKLPQNQHPLEELVPGTAPQQVSAVTAATGTVQHTARVAIETDYEYYARFNNTTNATNYVGNLIGYASTIYVNELNTSLVVQSVSLWTTTSDPWTQTDTLCGLMEFGRYWNKNRTNVTRTIAHFLSGKNLGGGIAWIGVLCSGSFGASANCPGLATDANWGGGYGFTASISGAFDINHPAVMWDIMAVAHEIGHNFNSPHSHCYNGIGGSSSPIDQCYSGESGCYSGPTSLPGPAGAGSGTLMSYCHLVRGSYSDISLSFGTNFPYGVLPGREAARMSSHVTTVASGNPSCLAPVASSSPAPTVSGASPSYGPTNANTPVTITGNNFQSGATVTFDTGAGAVAGGNVVVVSPTTLTAVAPPHPTGAVRVTVTNPDSQSGYRDKTFFYAPPAATASFYTLPPCRVVDTRRAVGSLGGPALAAGSIRTFPVAGVCGIPAGAISISVNVTVVAGTAGGFFSLFPGNAFPLGTSTINFTAGRVRANNSVLGLATDGTGTIGIQNGSAGSNHVIVDVNGYFQ